MTGAAPLLWFAAALGAAGIATLRFAWSLPRRSVAWNSAGWGLLLVAAAGAGSPEGAWGIAIAALTAMSAAAMALVVAGISSPPGRAAASSRRVGMLPEGAEPRRIGRRLGTFGLVMIGGLLASICLALAMRGLGDGLGWSEADANALALFTAPIVWAVLTTVLLMQTRRRSQIATLALCSLPVLPIFLIGAVS